MATKKPRPVHPGEVLREEFMQPLKLSSYRVAKELGVTAPTVNEIVRRRRAITAEMALRLSRYFGTTAQLSAEPADTVRSGDRKQEDRKRKLSAQFGR